MVIYYVLFLFILFYAIIDNKLTIKTKIQLLYLSGIILVVFAGIRGLNVDRDMFNYKTVYAKVQDISLFISNPKYFLTKNKFEPSLLIIFSFFKSLSQNGFQISIFLYALLGVTLKIKAISKISDQILLSLLLYFSTIFLLQDMTQIRVGVAVGFAFLSIPCILERKLLRFSVFILIGILFHYSVIVFVPFYFFNTKKIDKIFYLLVIIIPILLHFLNFNILDLLMKFDFGLYTNKLNSYVEMQRWKKENIHFFNFSIILQIILSIVFVIFNEKVENRYTILFTKIYCFGIATFYLLSFSPIIAFRLSEVLTSIQIFLIPMLIYIIKPKIFAESIVITISILYFLNLIIINNIFERYSTIFN